MKRLGLLGGTFDPVHIGHLQLGNTVLDRYGFDKILFIPAAHPPHKNETIVCHIEHRLQMLRLAIDENSRFEISEIEIYRDKMSYTIDTIEELKLQSGADSRFHFIIGFDAISEIETWHRWRELLTSTNFIVAVRPGFSLKEIEQLLDRNGFSPDRGREGRWICLQSGNEILFSSGEIANISSTEIRARIGANDNWLDLVPPEVGKYIIRNQLYTN